MKKILKELVKETRKVQNFKASPTEIKKIKENAKKFTDGNVAYWIRHAAINHTPKSGELEEV